jgi:hypothetical protein
VTLTTSHTTNRIYFRVVCLVAGVTAESSTINLTERTNENMTTASAPTTVGQEIVLFAKVGSQRFTLTANQLRDTVAAYLARGEHMPTPTDINGGDPNAPLHVIVEEWLWGNVPGWTNSADVVHLATYRHQAVRWIRGYFGPTFPGLEA